MEDIEMLLGKLEEELQSGKKALFGNAVSINPDNCYRLISQIKDNLPDAIREARYIVSEKEQMLSEASEKAAKILECAKAKAEAMIENSEITAEAHDRADTIIAEANEYRQNVEHSIRHNLGTLLKQTEATLSDAVMLVRNSREELLGSIIPSATGDDED